MLERPKKGLQEAIQRHYGPRLVVVPRHVAARMRRGDDRTRIVGPGTYLTEPFEYVEQIYNLQPFHRTYQFSKVLTQDLLALNVTVAIIYSINVPEDRWLGTQALTGSDRTKINDIDSWPLEWETVVKETVEKNTRLAIATTLLEDVLNVEQQGNVNNSIRLTVQNAIDDWGLTVHQVELLLIQPDPNVIRVSFDKYQEIVRSQAWVAAISAIATAYTEVRVQGLPDPVIYRELARRLFEQAPVSPATKTRLQSDFAHLFSTNVDADDGR